MPIPKRKETSRDEYTNLYISSQSLSVIKLLFDSGYLSLKDCITILVSVQPIPDALYNTTEILYTMI